MSRRHIDRVAPFDARFCAKYHHHTRAHKELERTCFRLVLLHTYACTYVCTEIGVMQQQKIDDRRSPTGPIFTALRIGALCQPEFYSYEFGELWLVCKHNNLYIYVCVYYGVCWYYCNTVCGAVQLHFALNHWLLSIHGVSLACCCFYFSYNYYFFYTFRCRFWFLFASSTVFGFCTFCVYTNRWRMLSLNDLRAWRRRRRCYLEWPWIL